MEDEKKTEALTRIAEIRANLEHAKVDLDYAKTDFDRRLTILEKQVKIIVTAMERVEQHLVAVIKLAEERRIH